MRRGFLLAVLGLTALLFAVILIQPRGGRLSTTQPNPTAPDENPTLTAEAAKESAPAARAEVPPSQPGVIAAGTAEATEAIVGARNEEHEARVAARVAELEALSTKTDRASLDTLLAEVRNADHEIRQAALDAISQSGNRAAIPGLREAAAQTTDSRDKQAILETIEFISLPTLTEILRGRNGTNRPAQLRP